VRAPPDTARTFSFKPGLAVPAGTDLARRHRAIHCLRTPDRRWRAKDKSG